MEPVTQAILTAPRIEEYAGLDHRSVNDQFFVHPAMLAQEVGLYPVRTATM
jgi:hypothetical protein